jgi:hypothetical protein
MTDLKIIGKPAEEAASPQAAFPSTNLQVTGDGLLIHIMLAPGLMIQQGIGEAAMNAICKQWLESRKDIKNQLATIRHFEKSKTK